MFSLPSLPGKVYVQPAECVVKIGGAEIDDLYPLIISIQVEATLARHAEARIVFASPADENDHWQVADDPRLLPGADIVVEADFQIAREEIMRGIVSDVTPNFPLNAGEATVTVAAHDDSARFDRAPRLRSWAQGMLSGTTDRAVLNEILSGTGVALDPESGPGQTAIFPNQRTTDIVFLRQRADANGYELLFEGGKLYFGPKRASGEPQPTVMVYAGQSTNCRSFSAYNSGEKPETYTYMRRDDAGDPDVETEIVAEEPLMGLMPSRSLAAGLPKLAGRLDRQSSPFEAENEARARWLATEGQFSIRADGELDGALYGHVLKVGRPVEVDGIGDAYSGRYYVVQVTHRFDVGGYRQIFVLTRNALGRGQGGSLGSVLSAVLGAL